MSGYNRIATPKVYPCDLARHLQSGWNTIADNYSVVTSSGNAFAPSVGTLADLFDLRPQRYVKIPAATKQFYIQINTGLSTDTLAESSYIAILGHNLHAAGAKVKVITADNSGFTTNKTTVSAANYAGHTKLINAVVDGSDAAWINPTSNGWSLFEWTDDSSTNNNQYLRITIGHEDGVSTDFDTDLYIGAIMYGEALLWPTPASVNATYQESYDGIKQHSSISGSTFSTAAFHGPPMWAFTPWMRNNASTTNIGATSSSPYHFYQPIGRKSLELEFDHIADTNLFAENQYNTSSLSQSYDSGDIKTQFYDRVLGSHLPFLFSISNGSTNESDYGIYRNTQDFQATQIAAQRWKHKLSLEESW